MGLSGLDWLALGWLATAATMASGNHRHLDQTPHLSDVEEAGPEYLALAEMRAAGRAFGLDAAQAGEFRSEHVRERAAWWSEHLRAEGVGPRVAERFVTAFVTGAHEAMREGLTPVARSGERGRARLPH